MAGSSSVAAKRRGPGRPFKKGQSGNPSGRPKVVAEVRELARQHVASAVRVLQEIMENPEEDARARVAAANALLDRGFGRPAQPIESPQDGQPIRVKLVWEDVGINDDAK